MGWCLVHFENANHTMALAKVKKKALARMCAPERCMRGGGEELHLQLVVLSTYMGSYS